MVAHVMVYVCVWLYTVTNSKAFESISLEFLNCEINHVILWFLFQVQIFFFFHLTLAITILLTVECCCLDSSFCVTNICMSPTSTWISFVIVMFGLCCPCDHSGYPTNLITVSLFLKIFTYLRCTIKSLLSWPKRFHLSSFLSIIWFMYKFRDASVSCFMLHRSFSFSLPPNTARILTTCCVVPWTTSSW